MDRLLDFLKSKGHLLLFLLLEAVALLMIINGSDYRKSVFLSTANVVTGTVMEIAHTAETYSGLRHENVALMKRNAELQKEVLRLKNQIGRITVDTLAWHILTQDSTLRRFPYEYIVGEVVGNGVYSKFNTLTINKGRQDGIAPDMGVLSSNGIVGVVEAVGEKYARVVPIVNPNLVISCAVGRDRTIASLKWDGRSLGHSSLINIPKHIGVHEGDSVFTSGYSALFPEHIFIGTIEGKVNSANDSFYALNVRLNTSFENIKYVYILKNYDLPYRNEVEDTDGLHTPQR